MLSLPAGTEMFHFPALPPPALCVQAGVTSNYARQVSPFGNPRIEVWLPTPRGLSQAPTSFIGSWCQGIHRVPLITWQLQMMLASTMQFSKYGRSRHLDRRVPRSQMCLPAREALADKVCNRGRSARCRSSPREDQRASLPSGPNSVLDQAVPAVRVPPASGCTNRAGSLPRPNNQCSTNEQPPQNIRLRCGSGRDTRWARARCSLERR